MGAPENKKLRDEDWSGILVYAIAAGVSGYLAWLGLAPFIQAFY